MTAEAHAGGVRALIEAAGVRLFEGERPADSPLPCAVLYMGTGTQSRTRHVPVSDQRRTSFQLTYVAEDVDGVLWLIDRIRPAVVDRRPAVSGHQTGPVVHDAAEPIRPDRDVTPVVPYAVDVFSFLSVPA